MRHLHVTLWPRPSLKFKDGLQNTAEPAAGDTEALPQPHCRGADCYANESS